MVVNDEIPKVKSKGESERRSVTHGRGYNNHHIDVRVKKKE